MYKIETAFQTGAKIADSANYDLILIQCSFNLLEDSMNSKVNKRADEYASTQRLITNIFRKVREVTKKPLGIKININGFNNK